MMALLQPAAAPAEKALYVQRRFDAPSTVVFRLWSSPGLLARWWGPRDFTAHSVEMDFRPGGAWRTVIRSPQGEDTVMSGIYREIVDGERIVFDLTLRGDPRSRLVTAGFDDVNGITRLGFRQAPFDDQTEIEAHAASWDECFDRLESYLLRHHWNNR